jgi:hypothetical protein
MNCKPGDLAVCISAKAAPHLIGKIVKCLSIDFGFANPHWNTEPEFRDPSDGKIWVFKDSCLRPIRDQDGTDETLLWAPVPKERVKA